MTIEMRHVDREYWRLVQKLVPDARTIIGREASELLDGGKKIEVGDEVYIFASDQNGGKGLCAKGEVTAAQAEERARMLTELAPYRETGHRLLMEALARRGNVAEALRAYERLRVLLREELGITPSPTVQGVHRRLLENAGS